MGRAQYYSPQISRFLVSALYHEAKHRNITMTKLTDELLREQLRGSKGWVKAEGSGIEGDQPTDLCQS